jgi:hypothetical protein
VKRISSAAYAIIAISTGTLVLLGYFLPQVAPFQMILLDWAVILSGFAVFVGVGNLFSVHYTKIRTRSKGYLYSFATLISMLTILLLGFVGALGFSVFTEVENVLLNGIMIPVEISLMAVLAVTLVYSSIRLLRDRVNVKSIVFILTVLFILLGAASSPWINALPFLGNFRLIISQVFATGGARGILIGVALGALMTGLRIFFGADRPYGGK